MAAVLDAVQRCNFPGGAVVGAATTAATALADAGVAGSPEAVKLMRRLSASLRGLPVGWAEEAAQEGGGAEAETETEAAAAERALALVGKCPTVAALAGYLVQCAEAADAEGFRRAAETAAEAEDMRAAAAAAAASAAAGGGADVDAAADSAPEAAAGAAAVDVGRGTATSAIVLSHCECMHERE